MDQLDALKELVTSRLDGVLREVLETQRLQRETNGRLRAAEGNISNMQPRLSAVEDEIDNTRHGLEDIGIEMRSCIEGLRGRKSGEAKEDRGLRLWDFLLVFGTVATTIAVLRFFGKL